MLRHGRISRRTNCRAAEIYSAAALSCRIHAALNAGGIYRVAAVYLVDPGGQLNTKPPHSALWPQTRRLSRLRRLAAEMRPNPKDLDVWPPLWPNYPSDCGRISLRPQGGSGDTSPLASPWRSMQCRDRHTLCGGDNALALSARHCRRNRRRGGLTCKPPH